MLGKLKTGSLKTASAALNCINPESPYSSENLSTFFNFPISEQNEEVPEKVTIEFLLPGESLDPEIDHGNDSSECLCNLSSGSSLYYVSVKIGDENFVALVDSGASRTFVSQSVRDKIKNFGFQVKKGRRLTVITPLGKEETVDENIKLPIILNTHCQKINVRVLPSLEIPIILGIDALRIFGINIHFGEHFYSFASDPTRFYHFRSNEDPPELLFGCEIALNSAQEKHLGLEPINEDQKVLLQKLLDQEIPENNEIHGMTTLASHHIDVGDSPAIKQRYYPVS